ncbi:MAG: hypothetical protein EPO21_08960 [Chloroflexota bacterium]|nr:MAG: hypothetical protein EPO21_08960 [Chloroflexota bacterium]
MRFGYMGGATIRMVWILLLAGGAIMFLTTLGLGMTGQRYPGLNLPSTPTDQVILSLVTLFTLAILVTPFFTAHELRARDLLLRQGLHFWAHIPYDQIEEVHYGTRRPIGIGVRWYPDEVFVVTWPANLVELRLRQRRSFRLFGIVPLPPVRLVAVNVDDPDRFLTALRQRVQAR